METRRASATRGTTRPGRCDEPGESDEQSSPPGAAPSSRRPRCVPLRAYSCDACRCGAYPRDASGATRTRATRTRATRAGAARTRATRSVRRVRCDDRRATSAVRRVRDTTRARARHAVRRLPCDVGRATRAPSLRGRATRARERHRLGLRQVPVLPAPGGCGDRRGRRSAAIRRSAPRGGREKARGPKIRSEPCAPSRAGRGGCLCYGAIGPPWLACIPLSTPCSPHCSSP